MDTLTVEGVRCFAERQSVRLRPITLLTGENSTGKSTILACARIAWDLCSGNLRPDFNEEPFVLGAFDEIASHRSGRRGRAREFTIAAEVSGRILPALVSIAGRFSKSGAQPALSEWILETEDLSVKFRRVKGDDQPRWRIETPSTALELKTPAEPEGPSPAGLPLALLQIAVAKMSLPPTWERHGEPPDPTTASRILRCLFFLQASPKSRPCAFAPIRSRPRRTYDPLRDVPEPEGSHVPMILAKLSSSAPEQWRQLREVLDAFGKESGLFRDIEVRRMGRSESGPFQVRIKTTGPPFNLIDVGYGVSQALPIVVDALRYPLGSSFLLQQPEIHLHPKAQAQLGSLFAWLAKEHNKRFLIETHSDHLVDRIRMEVREGKLLRPQDVSLLYFERHDGSVRVHELALDMLGNIENPPDGYRQFFLDEERRLLGG